MSRCDDRRLILLFSIGKNIYSLSEVASPTNLASRTAHTCSNSTRTLNIYGFVRFPIELASHVYLFLYRKSGGNRSEYNSIGV